MRTFKFCRFMYSLTLLDLLFDFRKCNNKNLLLLLLSPVFFDSGALVVAVVFLVFFVVVDLAVVVVVVSTGTTGVNWLQQTIDCVPTNPHIWGNTPPLLMLSIAGGQSVRNLQMPTLPCVVLQESPLTH